MVAHLARLAGILGLLWVVSGCSKTPPPEPADASNSSASDTTAAKEPPSRRYLKALQSTSNQQRREAIDYFARHGADAETLAAIVELLGDSANAGLGRTHPQRITSTREAAVRALLALGPPREQAIQQKVLGLLRAGLKDPQPAVREHTAYAVGLLGPLAQPLAAELYDLCRDPEQAVHNAAFDALWRIGRVEAAPLAALLVHDDPHVSRLAAELASLVVEVPAAAVPQVAAALRSTDPSVRVAAATLLALAGPAASSAAPELVAAIRASYPEMFDPMQPLTIGNDWAYWQALLQIGKGAAGPTAELLAHPHPLVQLLAAYTLGELGDAAAVDKLRPLLRDPIADVAIEAATAWLRLDKQAKEPLELLQQALDGPEQSPLLALGAIARLDQAALPLLPTAMAKLGSDNPYARYGAARLLGQLPPEQAAKYVPQLRPLLQDPFPVIRQQAAHTIQELGPVAASLAADLAKAWQSTDDEALRDAWIDAIIALGTEAKPALTALTQAAADVHLPPVRRLRIIQALPTIDPAATPTVQTLRQLLKDGDADVRAAAARALGRCDPLPAEAVRELLILATSDRRTTPRLGALLGLIAAGPRAAAAQKDLQPLAERTPLDGQVLLAQLASAAVQGRVATARNILRAALEAPQADVRAAAAMALELFPVNSADLPALKKLCRDAHPETRRAAADALGRIGPAAKEAVGLLVPLLEDGQPDVRAAAADALGRIGTVPPPAIPKLRQIQDDPVAGPAARRTLERVGLREPNRLRLKP